MSMEINDPGLPPDNEITSDDDLQPICPLDSIARSCIRDGSIQNIQLADVFNWKQVVDNSAQTRASFTKLFRKRTSKADEEQSPTTGEEISGHGSPVEMGIDALDCLDVVEHSETEEDEKTDSFQKTSDVPTTTDDTGKLRLLFYTKTNCAQSIDICL